MAVRIIPAQQVGRRTGAQEQKILRVAAYARVSTDEEAQETSYEAQVQHYTDYINNHEGWELAGVFADEGISGTSTAKREQFNKMTEACEAGLVDMVITKSISRWARNTLDSLNYIRKLKALGIRVIFDKENIDTMGSSGELLITIMSSLAQQESQSISQNVRMGMQYGFQQGKPMLCHTRFMGYTKKHGDKVLTIVPEETDIVRLIYRMFLEGFSVGEIAMELQEKGIKSPCGGDKWPHTTVRSMLRNEKFAGDLLLQKTYIEDFLTKKSVKNEGQFPQYYVENAHPPIVPKEVFMRVQGELLRQENEKKAGKATRQRCKKALFGMIRCGECGTRYRRYKDKGKAKWRCGKRVTKRNSCSGRAVEEDEVIDAVVCAFNRLPEKRDDIIRMQERILWGPLEETNHEIATIDQRKKELETIISDYAETGHLDRRTLFLYSDGDGEMDEEKAIDKIGSELEVLDEKRNALLIRKGDLGIQEANLHTLLKLVNGIIMKEEQQTVMLRSGTDDVPIARDPACYDLADFYERTDRITQWGLVQDYDNDLVRRFVEKILVNSARIEVKFKGGISVEV
jgi:site-specific DNA recombinase